MFWHSSREKHGARGWWHLGKQAVIGVEVCWWSRHCHARIDVDDEGWGLSLALPPVAVWLNFNGFGLWCPQYKTVATWDGNKEIWLPESREAEISMHDWTVRVTPWGRKMEWRKRDPWWIRGLSLNLPNVFLGRTRYTSEVVRSDIPATVPMPEGSYAAVAKVERQTWKRPLWFRRVRESVWLDIPKGIPHAGKGENSWDCGDDGLFGIGGDTLEDAIGRAVSSVLRDRKRYGSASAESIRKALAS